MFLILMGFSRKQTCSVWSELLLAESAVSVGSEGLQEQDLGIGKAFVETFPRKKNIHEAPVS